MIAEQLDIPTTEDKLDKNGDVVGEKPMTMDKLKEEIALNVMPNTCLIFPEAKRLTTGIRYWLEDLMNAGVRVVCFAVVNPQRDIFLEMIEVELELPGDHHIRSVMSAEADRLGLQISRTRLAELQPLAGRNPMLARKVIRNEQLGLNQKAKPEHTQYLVIMPILVAMLMAFGVVRFIGMGTQNKSLYIFGGVALLVGMTLKNSAPFGGQGSDLDNDSHLSIRFHREEDRENDMKLGTMMVELLNGLRIANELGTSHHTWECKTRDSERGGCWFDYNQPVDISLVDYRVAAS